MIFLIALSRYHRQHVDSYHHRRSARSGDPGACDGSKELSIFAITVFILSSAVYPFSALVYELVVFRKSFQGVRAGGLVILMFAIISDLIPPYKCVK